VRSMQSATPGAYSTPGSYSMPADHSVTHWAVSNVTDCDPPQAYYNDRDAIWLVGDALSIGATLLVLASFAGEELHTLSARRSVIALCYCDLAFHGSDLAITPLLLASWSSGGCGAAVSVILQILQPLYVVSNCLALLWAGAIALTVAHAFWARSADAPANGPLRWLPWLIWPIGLLLLAAFGASCALSDSCGGSNCAWPYYSLSNSIARTARLYAAVCAALCVVAALLAALLRFSAPLVVRGRLIWRLSRFLAVFTALWAVVLVTNNLPCGGGYPGPGFVWFWAAALVGYQGLINATLLSAQSVRSAMRRLAAARWMVASGPSVYDSVSRYVAFDQSGNERRGRYSLPPRVRRLSSPTADVDEEDQPAQSSESRLSISTE